MPRLEEEIRSLKRQIQEHDGRNVATAAFARRVDALIEQFYDDIGEIMEVRLKELFDLFVIKVLYVERGGRDAAVIDYLGSLLTRYLFTSELFPVVQGGRRLPLYLSDMIQETEHPSGRFQNLFEAYRKYGDNALFITGVFPQSLRRRRSRGGRYGWSAPLVGPSYFISSGKQFYRLAAGHELAEFTQQRETLYRLASYFEVYMDALNEISARYIMGFDMNLIANKLLDAVNRYRETRDERHLESARKYAAILKVDTARFPSLEGRIRPVPVPRPAILDGPPGY